MGNGQSSPLQQAAAHDDIDKVHALIAESRLELNGTDKVKAADSAAVQAVSAASLHRVDAVLPHTGRVDTTALRIILGQPQSHERAT